MTSRTRAEPDGAAGGVLEIRPRAGGRWTWCYREIERGVELQSNLDYPTREEAAVSARRAYPDVPFAPEDEAPGPVTTPS